MYDEYFLDYKCESRANLYKYMDILEKEIGKKIEFDNPYISGDFEKKVENFLNAKHISEVMTNPEIVLKEMAQYFSGTTRWHHPYVMNNIKTPVNLVSLAVAYNAMMYDPNIAGDTNCGQIAFAELEVVKYISELVGWDWKKSGGYFTFGGTSTLLNAVKIGLNKTIYNSCYKGIKEEVFIISSEQGHSAHADVCNWLGLGKESCIRTPVDSNYQMDIKRTEEIVSKNIEEGKKWIGVIACGGTTIQTIVDPLHEIYEMRERLVKKYTLSYKPHIHVDSVVGWAWLFFKNYSFEDNKLNLSNMSLLKIRKMYNLISMISYADSIGIDFHKTGFCPYASSLILSRDGAEIYKLNDKTPVFIENIQYGNYSPSSYTLELSRSSLGPLTALTALKVFGYEGYQKLLGDIVEGTCSLVDLLLKEEDFEVVNRDTNGTCVLFIIKPKYIKISYMDLPEASEVDVKTLAYYNYRFYLYVLNRIKKNKINFFIDYSSGYEKVKRGFHMGVLKMQTFNPMLSEEKAAELVKKIQFLKSEFDKSTYSFESETVYWPKGFKLKYKNNVYEIQGDKVCLKE